MGNRNLTSVDLFKFIAAILVIAIHCHPLNDYPAADYYSISLISRIAVPFFFVFSSYMFFLKDRPISVFIKRILILYCVWFVIELPFVYYRFFLGNTIVDGLLALTKAFFLSSTFYASWYLTATWIGMLVVYLLAKYTNKYLLYLVGIGCAFLSVSNSMYANISSGQGWQNFIGVTTWLMASNSFIAAIPYCILGRIIATNKSAFRLNKPWLLLPLMMLAVVEVYFCRSYYNVTDSYYMLYPLSIVLTVILISHNVPIGENTSRMLRNMSILVYLIHPIIIHILMFFKIQEAGMLLYVITLPTTLALSYLIVVMSKKFPILKYLY